MRRALITGITGQDGSFLTELLLAQGYEVHGLRRTDSVASSTCRIAAVVDRVHLHRASLLDPESLRSLLARIGPTEIYHLAAQSSVSHSFHDPVETFRSNVDGTYNLFSAILDAAPEARVYFATSSEMFGPADHNPVHERSPLRPISPYGISKTAAFHLARSLREFRALRITCGIAFNHESERRGPEFVTRKIARSAARIGGGLQSEMTIGNLHVRRDWGYAPEYVRAMWMVMTQHEPDDFIMATGHPCSLENLVDAAFDEVGLDWREHVRIDPSLIRAADIPELYGDASKIAAAVGWSARTVGEDVIRLMVRHEARALEQDRVLSAAPIEPLGIFDDPDRNASPHGG